MTLTTDTIQGGGYQWSIDGNDIPGATAQMLTADSSGSYGVLVTGSNGCSALAGSMVNVSENALPPAPTITQSFDTLLASGTGTFQWYLDGVLLPGATDAFHQPLANGTYTVTITDGNGCSSTSMGSLYLSTGIHGGEQVRFAIYPNPTSGAFMIALGGGSTGDLSYRVVDAGGRLVQQGRIVDMITRVDLSTGAGLYSVMISGDAGMAVQRMVVE